MIAFVLGVDVCFVFAAASYPLVTDFLSPKHAGAGRCRAARSPIVDRYQDFTRGIVVAARLIFFATFIGFWLFLNTVIVDQRKAD